MLLLDDPIQPYEWGRPNGIARLVGSAPTGGPEAELWVGTHPQAPSRVVDDPSGRTLAEVIAADPQRWLGNEQAQRGAAELPFLLKVLAIGSPLSLQAHPTTEQAQAGFAREEAAGIARDAPTRSYRDRSAKPEVLVALEPTWALCGFRPARQAADLVASLGLEQLAPVLAACRGSQPFGDPLSWLLGLEGSDRSGVADALAAAVGGIDRSDLDDPFAWVARLTDEHPNDPTALAPLLLELVRIEPGEAVHLVAGNLHAYLRGSGIEIMAASDNVLRGGLTSKHVDTTELLSVLDLAPGMAPRPARSEPIAGVTTYRVDEPSFGLGCVHADPARLTIPVVAPSLLLPVGGSARFDDGLSQVHTRPGQAVFVRPGKEITVEADVAVWWATTGDGLPGA